MLIPARGSIQHGIDPYPLRIYSGRTDQGKEIAGEEELYAELQRVFTAPETLSIVKQLRSLVAEQGAAGAAR